jgi:hypothetical protein
MMQRALGGIALLLGALSMLLAGRYGFKNADTLADGVIGAAVFSSVALCALAFHGGAVRLWFMRHPVPSIAMGVVGAMALLVTITNSLGAIASRADAVTTQRETVANARQDDRRELKRLQDALAALGKFTPADAAAVAAAKRAADTASKNREAECDKRGPNCRAREIDEQNATTNLASVTAAKTATEAASAYEVKVGEVRARLDKPTGEAIGQPNPLGAILERISGIAAQSLTAWQITASAIVFELCIVVAMVGYEALRHASTSPGAKHQATADKPAGAATSQAPLKSNTAIANSSRAKLLTKPKGSVNRFISENVATSSSAKILMRELLAAYRTWCTQRDHQPLDNEKVVDELEGLLGHIGVTIEVGTDQKVYCVGAQLSHA